MQRTMLSSGYLRLNQIIGPNGPLPISRSTLWKRVRQRTFPEPVKLGPRTTAWRADDIQAFLTDPEAWLK